MYLFGTSEVCFLGGGWIVVLTLYIHDIMSVSRCALRETLIVLCIDEGAAVINSC